MGNEAADGSDSENVDCAVSPCHLLVSSSPHVLGGGWNFDFSVIKIIRLFRPSPDGWVGDT